MAIRSVLGTFSLRGICPNRTSQFMLNPHISKCYKSTFEYNHLKPRSLHYERHQSSHLKNRVNPEPPASEKKLHFAPTEAILKKENQEILGVKPMKFEVYIKKHLLSYDQYYKKYCKSHDENTIKKGYELYCKASYNGYLNNLEFASPTIL